MVLGTLKSYDFLCITENNGVLEQIWIGNVSREEDFTSSGFCRRISKA